MELRNLWKAYPSSDGIYVCVVWNLVDCRITKDYNTQVITEIKGKLKHQDTQGYYWWDVVWGWQRV